jgi:flagellar hook-associated protein 2
MPSLSAAGLGSGLDVASLVQQLVAAERAPQQARINRQESGVRAQLSAFGTLQASFAALTAALAPLESGQALTAVSATSSNTSAFTVSAASGAAPGSYSIEVDATASAQRLNSAVLGSSSSAIVGTGTLTLTVGSASFDVVIDSSNNTVAGIRDAINNAVGNSGVDASIISAQDGVRLILAARNSGASQAIEVTRSGGDGGLDALVYDLGVLTNLSQTAPARDATIRIDGFNFVSSTNRFAGALEGVTIDVLADTTSAATLSVTRDAQAARKSLETLITAYNGSINTIANLSRADPANRTAAPLSGDSLARNARAALRAEVAERVTLPGTSISTALDIGISSNVDGTLKLDAAKFEAARSADPAGVAAYARDLATRLDGAVQAVTGTGGSLLSRTESLNARLRRIDSDKSALDDRMAQIEARFRAQFAALDSLVGRLRGTSDFLASQLARL